MIITTVLLFIISCLVLVVSGSFLVKSLVVLTRFLRISEYLGAFIIMAFSTSLPELFVGISSAIAKQPALSFGNVIGANIADLTLIGGIAILLARNIKIERMAVKRDSFLMVWVSILPVALMFIGQKLSRIDAIILLAVFFIYLYHLIVTRKRYSSKLKNHLNRWKVVSSVFVFIVSLGLLYGSAHYVVKYSTDLALGLAFPPILIGLFFLALGTTLPELVFTFKSLTQNHGDFAIGDIIGSIVVNSTLVLAVTALICPITSNFFLFLTSGLFMVFSAMLFATFVRLKSKFTYFEGITLIFAYVLFIIIELNMHQFF